MNENIENVLNDIYLQIKKSDKCEWDNIAQAFADVIKDRKLSREEVEEMSEKILKEIKKGKKLINYKIIDKEKIRKAIEECNEHN